MFAYTSIIGNYYYGEANLRYLLGDKPGRGYLIVFRVLSGGLFVLFGGYASLETVWSVGDLFMALITAVNLFAIVRLSPLVWRLLDQYRAQRKAGQDPVFHRSDLPGLELEAWQDEE
jgi:AGCS family alanine or glycine:cation symporter